MTANLFLLAINLTRRCNLACAHCYMDAGGRAAAGEDELTTAEVTALLDEIARRGSDTMVVLTGGEPLLRRDLEALAAHGSGLGLAMVVGTNGVLLDEPRARALQAAGVLGVGISLDSLDPSRHDAFRGSTGGWARTLAGMEACRRIGLAFQVHFTVTEANAAELPDLIAFARAVGAQVLNIFFLVCTGRGESMSDIRPQTYEQVLNQLLEAQSATPGLLIRARCAPHYKRVAFQRDPASPLTCAQGYEGGGCLAGIHYARITPTGEVTACPYIPDAEGSLREQGFWSIWDGSPTFARLRAPELRGRCGQCEFQRLCGGCRARPLALGGDLMDTDPWCVHQPTGAPVIAPLEDARPSSVTWSAEAEQRLARVPGFLRKMVRKRAEEFVAAVGRGQVGVEDLATLAQRRFGEGMPGRPGSAGMPSLPEMASLPLPLPWTAEAQTHLEAIPAFLRDGVRQVAEDVARAEGRLEVNRRLLQRLEAEDATGRRLPWAPAADAALERLLAHRPAPVRLFLQGTLEAAAEQEARRRRNPQVEAADVERFADPEVAGVEWSPEALARVRAAPEFIRGGIKKAAEWGARREGLARIESADLTRFRNRAMMRAVQRLKGLGVAELNFDAYALARERVPRLRDNPQGEQRFAAIRAHVETRRDGENGLGVLDRTLIERMKAELKGSGG